MPESRPRTRFIFVTGGVVSSLGKGIAAASIGRLLVVARASGRPAEVRPVHQRRPRHDVALPARRGVRHRGRRGDRPRPRPLRALHRREHLARRRTSPPARSTTRSSARERRGDYLGGTVQVVPHITDEIKHRIQLIAETPGRRRRDHRDRRHGGRHRVAAVPGGDPPVPGRRRPAQLHVHPPHARAVHRPRGRAEDQADPALGQRAAAHRHPARHAALPLRGRARARHPQEDRAVRRRCRPRRSSPPGTSTTSTRCRSYFRDEGVDDFISSTSGIEAAAARPARLGDARASAPTRPREPVQDRARRQVRPARGRLPVGGRGAAPRRLHARLPRSRSTGSTPRRSTTRRPRARSREADGILIPGGFGGRGDRGQDPRGAVRARAADPVPGHLPRHADRGRRVRPPRRRHGRRELDRVRPRDRRTR